MNWKEPLLGLAVLLCLMSPAIACAQTNAEEYCETGKEKRFQGDLDGAITDYSRAIRLDPKMMAAYVGRGQTKSRKGDFDGAIKDFTRAIAIDGSSAAAHIFRGSVYFMQHKWAEAVADLRKCCELDSQQADYPHLLVWFSRVRLGEKEAADKELSDYFEKRGSLMAGDWPVKVSSFLLGRMSESDLVDAAGSAETRQDRGQRCEAWFYAGLKRLLLGDKTAAAGCFSKSVATEARTWLEYHFAQVELKALGGSVSAAAAPTDQERLRRLAKLPTIELLFYFSFGSAMNTVTGEKSSPAALAAEIAAARQEQEAHPNDAACYVRLGELYSEADNTNAATRVYAKACGLFQKRLESQPNDGDSWLGYGKALRGSDRLDEGEVALRKAVKLAPQNSAAWTALGGSLMGKMFSTLVSAPKYHDVFPFTNSIAYVTQHPLTVEAQAKARCLLSEVGECYNKAVDTAPQSGLPYLQRFIYRTAFSGMVRAMLDKQPASPALVLDPNVLADLRKAVQLDTKDYRSQFCCAMFDVLYEMFLGKIETKSYRDIWPKLSEDARQSVNDAMLRLSSITMASDNTKAAEALEALGVLQCFIRGDSASGIATLRRAITLDPTREQAWDMLVGVLAEAHRADDIVAVCQQRLDAKKSVRNHLLMAIAWDLQGRSDSVETHVRAAITLQPDDVLANLAQAALSVRRARDAASLDLASQRIAAAAALFTDATPAAQRAEIAVLRCIHAALSGQLDRANDCLDEALRLDPANASAKGLLEVLKPSRHAAGAQGATTAAAAKTEQPSASKSTELRAKAEKGDAQSQVELGKAFFHGTLGLAKDAKEAVKWFQKAAEQNNASAQFNLGCCYDWGWGVTKDVKEAAKWYRRAAEQNHANAQYNLGCSYEQGSGVTKDQKEAVKWYRKAAEQNRASAQFSLGWCYEQGLGVTKDEKEAVKWYRKAAEQDYASAQFNLGCSYDTGRGVAKDEKEAVKWYRKAAEQNHAGAQYGLGVCYETGRGVAKDAKEAVALYRKAAKQNYANAQYVLGCCYDWGRGVTKDEKEAVTWYRKAAEQKFPDAQYNLGCCYQQGSGVAKDEKEAVTWYRKAAERNFARAQYNMGCCYERGQGVAKDVKEAVTWFRKAAGQNHAGAQCSLGDAFLVGRGVTKDGAEAVRWYRKAAEQNYALAQHRLGVCCSKGEGTGKDVVEGYRWLLLSARQGHTGAKKAAAELEGTLKAAQIEEGKWRADDWTEHYKFKTR